MLNVIGRLLTKNANCSVLVITSLGLHVQSVFLSHFQTVEWSSKVERPYLESFGLICLVTSHSSGGDSSEFCIDRFLSYYMSEDNMEYNIKQCKVIQ